MSDIRVLIVDDSPVTCQLLKSAIDRAEGLVTVGLAKDGATALELVPQCAPDVIVLDVEMPGMSGLQVLERLRHIAPHIPVIIFSAVTDRAATSAAEALARGAVDVLPKPSGVAACSLPMHAVMDQLMSKLVALGDAIRRRPASDCQQVSRTRLVANARGSQLIVVGASTGGPRALLELLVALQPSGVPPVVVAQHMLPGFTRKFAEQLDRASPLTVRELSGSQRLRSDTVWIVPGGSDAVIRRDGETLIACVCPTADARSATPSVDRLFATAAQAAGDKCWGVVLSGMGSDGREGSRRIRETGGTVLAQDEPSSVVWGMPGAVVEAGIAHACLTLGDIASTLRVLQRPPIAPNVGREAAPYAQSIKSQN